jgi:ATP-dependent DNA helicase
VLPDIFSNLDSFQEWFNLPTVQEEMDAERTSKIMQSLHAILKPFLLRRLKVDVEKDLPPKKEYVLYAPLTSQQRVMYDAITQQQLRQLLIAGKQADHVHEPEKQKLTRQQLEAPRKTRGKKPKKSYDVDGDDDEYFDQIEANKDDHPADGPEFVNGDDEAREIGKAWTYKAARECSRSAMSESTDHILSQESEHHELTKHSHATSERFVALCRASFIVSADSRSQSAHIPSCSTGRPIQGRRTL